LEANAANTRLVLIHLGGAQGDMSHSWDGATALEHMNAMFSVSRKRPQLPTRQAWFRPSSISWM
jgi:hypothetical protein